MAKVINCECGFTVRGESEDQVLAGAQDHVERDHPELVGELSRDDLLGLVEEA